MHEFLSISFTHHIAILTKAKTYKDFLATIPDYKKVYRAIRMFKDVYLLDFINVEELGMHDEDINESVIVMTKRRVRIEQGISDTQNGIVLKIFSLINYGERAGSGLNSIFHVWEHVYHTPAEINEEVGVDRVIVTLPMVGMNRM